MIYASTKTALIMESGITKAFDIRDQDEMTEEWLLSKLAFFK